MNEHPPLIIRADASPEIGTGHVMRCLALAEAWQDHGGNVFFVSAYRSPALEERLKNEGIESLPLLHGAGTPEDADETARIARERGAGWIVTDGYHFGAEYQKIVHESGLSLLVIDDYGHADHYYADIVLNPNLYADMSFYTACEPYTRFLLGPAYVLIRREFLNWPGRDRKIPESARKLLITLGGSDPDNRTLCIIEAVKAVDGDDLEIILVAGGANPHLEQITRAVADLPNIHLVKNAENMPELMAWADAAISAGGSTCGELLFMGAPFLVIPIAGNQVRVVNELQSLHLAEGIDHGELGNPEKLARKISGFLHSPEDRSGFSKRMARHIDGKGALRILCAMGIRCITLRHAERSDCRQVWQWINDPLVRSVSFISGPIPLERHAEWFSSALENPDFIYYIGMDNLGRPIGQARFTIESNVAIISVLVDPGYRGMSLGPLLIRNATEKLFCETEVTSVKAFIKTSNEISRKAFLKAGYRDEGLTEYSGENAYLLITLRGKR